MHLCLGFPIPTVKDFMFPAGFPESVSEDYLQHMLLQFPANVTAWICHTLVTSSLLKASVGVGSFSGTSAAAIRWVSKDCIGALKRLFIGGRFGNLFDDNPKQWRMYADFIGSAGSIFNLTAQVYPAYFLPLASLGNLAKDTPGLVRSYPVLGSTWLSIRLLHLLLRYQSLSVLRFNTINLKRARMLVKSHVLYSTVPGYVDCNKEEDILSLERFMKPRIIFGVPLEEMVGGEESVSKVKTFLRIYAEEKYILTMNQQARNFEIFISFKVEATSVSVLRSVWQTYWLHEKSESVNDLFDNLSQSLLEMEDRFEDFLEQLDAAGWDTLQLNLKVPKEISIDELSPV
ncbi:hypothetical protein Ddye_009875 [Dipteronia dyeriana]|uniref:Uncharacterized protein n=1 Tax=Dipteronia dyeriana TaxID=168575 RepID=A0AAD9XCH5_9ROSI|nr:hypothetical protein Ddye_009875 [Dipteronia dyeriana]